MRACIPVRFRENLRFRKSANEKQRGRWGGGGEILTENERASVYGWMEKTNSAVPERNKNIKKKEKTDQKRGRKVCGCRRLLNSAFGCHESSVKIKIQYT